MVGPDTQAIAPPSAVVNTPQHLPQAFVAVAGPFANVVFTVVVLAIPPILAGVTSYPWQIDRVTLEGGIIGLQSGKTLHSMDGIDITSQDTLIGLLSRLPSDTHVATMSSMTALYASKWRLGHTFL